MPIYEYKCLQCRKNHELMQKFSDELLRTCPNCGGEVKKLISNTSFVLKGSGWYVTDYVSPERKKAVDSEKGTSDKKPSETKPEVKTETKPETKSNLKEVITAK